MIVLQKNQRVLWQWSLDQRVVIDGFLAGTKVEFSLKYDCKDSALPVTSYKAEGHVYADIPNVLLQKAGYLHVAVLPSAADADHAPAEKDFKIVQRERPEDYDANYTETPTQSMENKIDRYWGKANYGKALIIGADGYITAGEPTGGGGGGGGVTSEDDGQGNVTINVPGLTITDDGGGNVVIG